MSVLVVGECCTISKEDESFWDTHQTISDGHIWCVTKSIVDKAKADVRSKYGNKKRHRQ
jgi:hypothetical protein